VHSDFVCALFGNVLKLRFRDDAFVVKRLFFFSGMDSSSFSSFSHCFHKFVEERLFNVFFNFKNVLLKLILIGITNM
jgi:hypothetical protein